MFQTKLTCPLTLPWELGSEISQKKLETPTTQLNCLGIIVDTIDFTVSISHDKLKEITTTCHQRCRKSHCTKPKLHSLLGSLLYVSKWVRTYRFFLNRLLDV